MKTIGLVLVAALLFTGCPAPWCDFVPGAKCDEEEREYVAFEDHWCPDMGLDLAECRNLVSDPDCPTVGPEICLGNWEGW